MTEPAIIKNGIASKGKDSALLIKVCIIRSKSIFVLIKAKNNNADPIKENAIGTFKKNKINRTMIGIKLLILLYYSPFIFNFLYDFILSNVE